MIKRPEFTSADHETWKILFSKLDPLRDEQLIPEFGQGLKLLEITAEKIPDLQLVNQKLQALTGWQGVYVSGFAEAEIFFEMLSNRQFPIGNFIRDQKDLSYTPAPDVFHDLYGHIPFYTMPAYAQFCEEFGLRALKYKSNLQIITEFQRLFWFAIEFGLLETSKGLRVFGAGIASSFSECSYALSDRPRRHDFDFEVIRKTDFRIDIMQEDLFVLKDVNQLFGCLDQFERKYL